MGALPPLEFRGKAPGQGLRGFALLKLERISRKCACFACIFYLFGVLFKLLIIDARPIVFFSETEEQTEQKVK
jgi:hypothetical protein